MNLDPSGHPICTIIDLPHPASSQPPLRAPISHLQQSLDGDLSSFLLDLVPRVQAGLLDGYSVPEHPNFWCWNSLCRADDRRRFIFRLLQSEISRLDRRCGIQGSCKNLFCILQFANLIGLFVRNLCYTGIDY